MTAGGQSDRTIVTIDGFTLIEICISIGLLSVIILAFSEINLVSQRSAQANAAADEFNSNVNLLLSVVNSISQSPGNANQNGCTYTFGGLAISAVTALPVPSVPVISAAQIPLPLSLTTFIPYINSGAPPIALYNNSGVPIIQVGAPSAQSANANYPAPTKNLWITNLYFNAWLDTNFLPPPALHTTWVANLYQLHLDAQKVSTGLTLLGGATTYSKDFLVTLWVDSTNHVIYCGGNPI